MEIQGRTAVDTLYEYAGYSVGGRLAEYLLWTGYIPAFLVGAGLLRLLYMGYRREGFTDLAAYPLYLLFVGFLLWPVEAAVTGPGGAAIEAQKGLVWDPSRTSPSRQVGSERPETLQVPRLLAVTHSITDALVGSVVGEMEERFSTAAFAWQRVAAINEKARLLDPDLRGELQSYLDGCYWPAAAKTGGAGPGIVPLLEPEGWLSVYDGEDRYSAVRSSPPPAGGAWVVPCRAYREEMKGKVERHLGDERFHREALEAYRLAALREGNSLFSGERYREFYLRRILYNETFGPEGNEARTLRKALPEYSVFRNRYWGTGNFDTSNFGNAARGAASFVATGVASLMEGWNQEALGPSTYYRVSSLAPYIYGLVSAILLMGFPIAGLLSLWPGGWPALVNFLKVFISVKLWPVFWAFLSRMNVERGRFRPDDPGGFEGTFGQSEMFAALAGMYLLVPLLSYLLVGIMKSGAALTMGALVGPGATGSGQAAVVVHQAVRSVAG